VNIANADKKKLYDFLLLFQKQKEEIAEQKENIEQTLVELKSIPTHSIRKNGFAG
jgi:hypothetical protein